MTYSNENKGALLPRIYGCPEPERDSALSSWIMLVAATKGVPAQAILKAWNYRISSAYDADISRHIPPLAAMSSMTFQCPRRLAEIHWSGRTFLSNKQFASLTASQSGLPMHRYCPKCLAQDRVPYIRLSWRLSFQFICPKHQCFLLERCPACKALIDYSGCYSIRPRQGIERLFRLCPHCGDDLSLALIMRPQIQLLDYLLKTQQQLEQLLRIPFVRHPTAGTVASSKIFQSYLIEQIVQEGDVPQREVAYSGLSYRRLFMNYYADIAELFLANPCLPTILGRK